MQQINGTPLIHEITPDDLRSACGGRITLFACVHRIRKASGVTFVTVRTGRHLLQAVYSEKTCTSALSELCEGAYTELSGIVAEEPRAIHGYEIVLTEFSVLSRPAEEYPLKVSDRVLGCTLDASLKNRAVALRHPHERAVFKISEGVTNGFREFMQKNGFTEIHTPKIGSVAAEGGTNVFKLSYFGNDAMLAQSPQLYKQIAVAFFDRVFEIAPAFRADKHNSARHLNEYTGLDLEMGYIKDMTDVMEMTVAMLKHVISHLQRSCGYELDMLGMALPVIGSIPSVTFYEALDILGKPHDQPDLDPTDEAKLCEFSKREYMSELIFVTKFPGAKRPFYLMDSADDPELCESFELLFRGVETASGGQRIHDYEAQLSKLRRYGLDPAELADYLAAHKYGLPPHGGLGMGLERFVMKLSGLDNIRQASLFPRDMHHFKP